MKEVGCISAAREYRDIDILIEHIERHTAREIVSYDTLFQSLVDGRWL